MITLSEVILIASTIINSPLLKKFKPPKRAAYFPASSYAVVEFNVALTLFLFLIHPGHEVPFSVINHAW